MAIVKANKWTTFALWTKRKNVIKEYFDKVFNNVDKDTLKDRQNCTGQQCITCRRCYIKSNDNTIIEAVKTNGRPKNLPKITVIKSNRI